ncbi:hypothetical protein HYH02_006200 [Chlamydomonas schloesseri]|uniref:CREG-like beta-barrel domain-containing protein n=1 Tax=Chlamydomonas schloesseri TaxID=2026947 RepID=A0A835WKD1_9CHLO|nr:hypothetical protein HYH02_006200 [Chlamydomonas schloesseri]|eukprot:KAG2448849.1 hypothetical protein HYH02_006200 [Chlamydomonas schloesseri]
MTPMDELTQNVISHPRSTFTVSEMQRRTSTATASGGSTQRASIAQAVASARVTSGAGELRATTTTITTTNGPCGALDPEDPACARATFVGRVLRVPEQDRSMAQTAMFARHPAMADWPTGHQFDFYELHVTEVHLLDWYGGMSIVDANDYYSAEVGASAAGNGSLPGTTGSTSHNSGKGGRGAGGAEEVVLKEGAGYRIVMPAKRLRGHA